MSGGRRKIAHKPYNTVKHEELEERIREYDGEVAKAFNERFADHDRQIREDLDELFVEQDSRAAAALKQFERQLRDRLMVFLYVLAVGTAAALAIAIVALILAV